MIENIIIPILLGNKDNTLFGVKNDVIIIHKATQPLESYSNYCANGSRCIFFK